MPFARMADWMESLKLSFAGSAHYLDQVDILNLTPEQRALLAEIPDRDLRETSRDFLVNQRFRRDYWIRGARRLTSFEQSELVRAESVVLVDAPDKVKLGVIGALGEAKLDEAVYRPLVEVLADHRVHSIGDIARAVAASGPSLAMVVQALTILIGNGSVHAAQDAASIQQAQAGADALNGRIAQLARYSSDVAYLASPVTGGGIIVSRFEQLFLMARRAGLATPDAWAAHISDLFAANGQRILLNGKPAESTQEQLTELTRQATEFAQRRLPILIALGIAR